MLGFSSHQDVLVPDTDRGISGRVCISLHLFMPAPFCLGRHKSCWEKTARGNYPLMIIEQPQSFMIKKIKLNWNWDNMSLCSVKVKTIIWVTAYKGYVIVQIQAVARSWMVSGCKLFTLNRSDLYGRWISVKSYCLYSGLGFASTLCIRSYSN